VCLLVLGRARDSRDSAWSSAQLCVSCEHNPAPDALCAWARALTDGGNNSALVVKVLRYADAVFQNQSMVDLEKNEQLRDAATFFWKQWLKLSQFEILQMTDAEIRLHRIREWFNNMVTEQQLKDWVVIPSRTLA
jgi:hypothetical protein